MRTLLTFCILISLLSCKHTEEQSNDAHGNHLEDSHAHDHQDGDTVYYLIRHAEKDRTDPENKDPELTQVGHTRALVWASYFEDKILDAVYSSDYARTRQTAQPTADSKLIELTLYEPRKLYGPDFLEQTKGKNVLIVGHSNTIPDLVNDLIGSEDFEDLDDGDNSSLFIVTIRDGSAIAARQTIDLPEE